jgi:hypothetical protein
MRRLSVSLLVLLAGTFSFAQTPNHSAPATASQTLSQWLIAPHDTISSAGCPVGFSARRQAIGQIMSASDARQYGPAQGLHLTLNHLSSTPDIESIEVRVYGTSPKERVLPVGQQATDTVAKAVDPRSRFSDTVTKTFELHCTTGSDSLSDADVWMHQVGSVRWADLISITFTDGTTWRPTENLKCRAVPSNFLLVANQ